MLDFNESPKPHAKSSPPKCPTLNRKLSIIRHKALQLLGSGGLIPEFPANKTPFHITSLALNPYLNPRIPQFQETLISHLAALLSGDVHFTDSSLHSLPLLQGLRIYRAFS